MGTAKLPLFFQNKPLFGLDIGTGSVKIMQIDTSRKKPTVKGYGAAVFDPGCIENGVLINPEPVAAAIKKLIDSGVIGTLNTRRVALSIPASFTYARELILPHLPAKELPEAINTEAEQYIPRALDELYIDYTVNERTDKDQHIYTVAAPKNIIDSYVDLTHILGLEPISVTSSLDATTRLLTTQAKKTEPCVLIDFGTKSADISIFDKYVTVTGTVQAGGDLFTERIMKHLDVSEREAVALKTKYGVAVSGSQADIRTAVAPLLQQIIREVKRMLRYYTDRSGDADPITHVITMGGGANMPGINTYIAEQLKLPTDLLDPWQVLDYGRLQPPNVTERTVYLTVAGLALTPPKEVFS